MSPEKKRTVAEDEAPNEDAPLTKEMLSAQIDHLIERARAAGLNPIQMLLNTYKKRGTAII